MVEKVWKIYGAEGHRQRISFDPSFHYDFSDEYDGTRILDCLCSDVTGTNEYVVLAITRDTARACNEECSGQITDGIFENARVGLVEETQEFGEMLSNWRASLKS